MTTSSQSSEANAPPNGAAGILPTHRTRRSFERWTDGPDAGEAIAQRTGRQTTRWQQYVLDVGLERVDGPDSPYAYSTVDTIVGRRCGKTVTMMGVPLYRGLLGPVTLDNGVRVPFLGAHTAQNLTKARQRFIKDLVEPFEDSMTPAQWEAGSNLRTAMGDTYLTFDPFGRDWKAGRSSVIQVFAPTVSAVRGDGLLHLGFDEVLVWAAARGQEFMAAARPTLGSLRGHGQVWRSSNVTMLNDKTTWLAQIRDRGRRAVDADVRSGNAYFEFTIPDDADPTEESVWWDYYPALHDGIIRPEELRADLVELGVDHFAAEYLGRWPSGRAAILWAAFDRDVWAGAGTDEPQSDKPAGVGLDIDPFGRSATFVSFVDGIVEVLDHRPGADWVFDEVLRYADRADVATLAIDDYGPGHELIGRLEDVSAVTDKLIAMRSADFISACYLFDAGIREGAVKIRRSDFHEALNNAAASAQRTPGRSWQWERRVAVSQTPLVAATLALWAAEHGHPTPDSQIF